jgi:hypothetical protein
VRLKRDVAPVLSTVQHEILAAVTIHVARDDPFDDRRSGTAEASTAR